MCVCVCVGGGGGLRLLTRRTQPPRLACTFLTVRSPAARSSATHPVTDTLHLIFDRFLFFSHLHQGDIISCSIIEESFSPAQFPALCHSSVNISVLSDACLIICIYSYRMLRKKE